MARLDVADHPVHFSHLLRFLGLRKQNQVRTFTHNFREIFQAHRQLINSDHAFARSKIDCSQSIPNQDTSRVLLAPMHRVLQVENYGIRPCSAALMKYFGSDPGR